MAFDWNRGLLPQLVDGISDATKQRLQDMVSGKGLVGQENAAADLEMRKRQGIAASPVSVVDTPNDMAAATRRAQGILVPADQPDPQREAFARGQSLISSLPQPTRPAATELQPLLTTALPTITAQPAPPSRMTSGLGGNRLTVMDQGNGGTVEGNVAALNRQTEALRSLNEARGVYGQGGGGDNRAFGDLVSIGRAGESFGDDAMRAESARRLVSQANGSSWVPDRQRRGMLESAGILMGMNQLDTSPRRQAPNPLAMTDYQRGQLGLSRDQLAIDTLTQQNQNDLALKRFGLDQGIAQSTQALGRDRLTLDQSNALANQALKRDELGVEREKNQASLAAAMAKPTPYQAALQEGQAKQDIERSQAKKEMTSGLTTYLDKIQKMEDLASMSGPLAPTMAKVSSLWGGEQAAKAEQFTSLSNDSALGIAQAFKGAMSDKDIELSKSIVTQLSNTPEGNRKILKDMRSHFIKKALSSGADINELVQQRGAALEAAGYKGDKLIARLKEEFDGAY